jgi:hypothetical protein
MSVPTRLRLMVVLAATVSIASCDSEKDYTTVDSPGRFESTLPGSWVITLTKADAAEEAAFPVFSAHRADQGEVVFAVFEAGGGSSLQAASAEWIARQRAEMGDAAAQSNEHNRRLVSEGQGRDRVSGRDLEVLVAAVQHPGAIGIVWVIVCTAEDLDDAGCNQAVEDFSPSGA